MKFPTLMLSLVLSVIPSISFGADEQVPFEFSMVSQTDEDGEARKINVSDIKKGVFVTAVGGWSDVYQRTANLFKAKLVERGIKVVEKPEDADFGLQVYGLAFDLEEVETGIDAGFDGKNAAAIVAGAFLTGGINIIGELARPASIKGAPVSAKISVKVAENPEVNGRGKMGGDNEEFVTTALVFHSNDDGAKRAKAVYLGFIDGFIERHFVFDTPQPQSQAVAD